MAEHCAEDAEEATPVRCRLQPIGIDAKGEQFAAQATLRVQRVHKSNAIWLAVSENPAPTRAPQAFHTVLAGGHFETKHRGCPVHLPLLAQQGEAHGGELFTMVHKTSSTILERPPVMLLPDMLERSATITRIFTVALEAEARGWHE
jgi:hypothetical protein